MRVAIIAGEASGDVLGASLIRSLKEKNPSLKIEGVCGPLMLAEGCHPLGDIQQLSVMGFVEVFRKLPLILLFYWRLLRYWKTSPPDLFIGIDAPDFNMRIERQLKKRGCRVIHYVSPSVWAWKENRVYTLRRDTDCVLTLFPFEVAYYKRIGHPAYFVGHPLAKQLPLTPDKKSARKELGLKSEGFVLAVLPGSRKSELAYLSPVFIETVNTLKKHYPQMECIAPMANTRRAQQFNKALIQAGCDDVHVIEGHAAQAMTAADVVLLASGTATLEAMLCKRPMVVAYKMPSLTYWLAKKWIKTKYIALPNILANEGLVPEFIQQDVQVMHLVNAIKDWKESACRVTELISHFYALHEQLMATSEEKIEEVVEKYLT